MGFNIYLKAYKNLDGRAKPITANIPIIISLILFILFVLNVKLKNTKTE